MLTPPARRLADPLVARLRAADEPARAIPWFTLRARAALCALIVLLAVFNIDALVAAGTAASHASALWLAGLDGLRSPTQLCADIANVIAEGLFFGPSLFSIVAFGLVGACRVAYESRRKQMGLLRPAARFALRDICLNVLALGFATAVGLLALREERLFLTVPSTRVAFAIGLATAALVLALLVLRSHLVTRRKRLRRAERRSVRADASGAGFGG